MKKNLILLFLFFSCFAFSQSFQRKHSYDVLNYKLYLDLFNCYGSTFPKSYTATNIITFRVDSVLNFIKLDASNNSLIIDSVALAGKTFAHVSNILTINLDKTYNPGDTAEVKIYYRHKDIISDESDSAIIIHSDSCIYTDCEPEGTRKWFPCWDKPSDKATTDITARVPKDAVFVSNGSLKDSIRVGDTIYYHWISRDPVATCLIAIASGVNYNIQKFYWHKISNPNDSIPVMFYYKNGEDISLTKNIVDSMIDCFSNLFGEYPFEKLYYVSVSPNDIFRWWNMGNQTLVRTIEHYWPKDESSYAISEQWFGDLITCGTWADIFVNEGIVWYAGALWLEHAYNYNKYKNEINNDAAYYLFETPGWPIYDSLWAIKTPPVLFNSYVTYYKAACVLHMLRYVVGDSLFFKAFKKFTTDTAFMFKTAVVKDFTDIMQSVSGRDLSWFFDEWIYKPNHPVYFNNSYIDSIGAGNWRVRFKVQQFQSNPPLFKMPVQLKIMFQDMTDTIVKFFNDSNNQTFSFYFNKEPKNVTFDPFNNILPKVEMPYCNDVQYFTDLSATIEDGSDVGSYGDNTMCTWDIKPLNNPQSIKLHFLEFDTEEINDKLAVWNADVLPNQRITTFSGSVIPQDFICNTKRIKLKFFTNYSITGQGWKLIYTTDVGIEEKSGDV
ncbi:MAG: M1 family aminopeptidase, partial [Bacteroidales bacterium]|nr:M1 family aminopeptidase [Bacteroidales bacterium]